MEQQADRSAYGAYIKAARGRAGLTIEEAAKRAGMTYDGLSKIERNVTSAKLSTLERLSAVYGCLIGDMLPNSGLAPEADRFEALLAAMAGMTDDEIEAQILALSSQVRVNRMQMNRLRPGREMYVGDTPVARAQIQSSRPNNNVGSGYVVEMPQEPHAREDRAANSAPKTAGKTGRTGDSEK
jgi:transcriptional regulator with XRE-family HTH domain